MGRWLERRRSEAKVNERRVKRRRVGFFVVVVEIEGYLRIEVIGKIE